MSTLDRLIDARRRHTAAMLTEASAKDQRQRAAAEIEECLRELETGEPERPLLDAIDAKSAPPNPAPRAARPTSTAGASARRARSIPGAIRSGSGDCRRTAPTGSRSHARGLSPNRQPALVSKRRLTAQAPGSRARGFTRCARPRTSPSALGRDSRRRSRPARACSRPSPMPGGSPGPSRAGATCAYSPRSSARRGSGLGYVRQVRVAARERGIAVPELQVERVAGGAG